jgi:hypothetical protein
MIFLEKSKNVDFGLFGLCLGPLDGACTAKMGPKGQKVEKAGKKLVVWGWSGAEQIFEFGRKWAWGWFGGGPGPEFGQNGADFNESDLIAQKG